MDASLKTFAGRALLITLAVTAVLLLMLLALVLRQFEQPGPASVDALKVYAELFKTVLVGFAVALAGILIPAIYTETNNGFERLKDSRSYYSKAKTGADYLPLRLSNLPLLEAASLIQQVHQDKHQAELFGELKVHLDKRYDAGNPMRDPDFWGDAQYLRLFRLRGVLEAHADAWDRMKPAKRLALLHAVQPPVNELTAKRIRELEDGMRLK